jgi:GAF domain
MPTDRLSAVLREIVEADVEDSASLVDRVCVAAVGLLSLRGAGLSLMVDGELRGTAGVSDPGIAVVQELQLTLGEGPCGDAWMGRAPVLEANLADPAIVRWPAFAQAGIDAGVLAVFAFPLHLGAIRIGVLVLYRDYPSMLSADEMAYGLVLADVATQVLLSLQAGAPTGVLHEVLANEPTHWAEVHQATGMVSVQLDVSLDEAFVRLRAHAFAEELPLRIVAREIVTRQRRLEEPA